MKAVVLGRYKKSQSVKKLTNIWTFNIFSEFFFYLAPRRIKQVKTFSDVLENDNSNKKEKKTSEKYSIYTLFRDMSASPRGWVIVVTSGCNMETVATFTTV